MNDSSVVPPYISYWGKARESPDSQVGWHPLAYHSIDVAAVAAEMLRRRPCLRSAGRRLLGVPEDDLMRFVPALIAMHDVGKVEAAFQAKAPHAGARPLRAERRLEMGHHTKAGLALWFDALGRHMRSALLTSSEGIELDDLARAVFGHHGRPVPEGQLPATLAPFFAPDELRDAEALCRDLSALFLSDPIAPPSGDLAKASWWLAGLTTLADWIGSNTKWFPYAAADLSPAGYLQEAAQRSIVAVREAGLVVATSARAMSFEDLTRHEERRLHATPAQRWAETVLFPGGSPLLCVIEDVTGSGKTEAAQMLVHRLLASGRCEGAFWAMPTMATANAMYLRQGAVIGRLFGPSAGAPSLALAHGRAGLNADFRDSVVVEPALLEALPRDIGEAGDNSIRQCAAWLAADRRRALLADVGAGTIDQALLGILPAKFNVLRLAGLSGKVVVLDEVHAYDTYVGTLLEQLLEWLAGVGASVVLLSATLPMARRRALLEAWRRGAHETGELSGPPPHESSSYPLAAMVPVVGPLSFTPLSAAPDSHSVVEVRRLHSADDALHVVAERVRMGDAVAWIRNTVRDCQAAAERARAVGLRPIVFHSRFAQCDRQVIEAEVLRRLGPKPATDRAGTLVVATQVIEQSLDIDFDAMVTDLAPIDLLLQRAGRLWRHAKRTRPADAVRSLHVLEPPGRDRDPREWRRELAGTARVYRIAPLWRTSLALDRRQALNSPGDVRALVEEVYGDDAAAAVPDVLQEMVDHEQGRGMADAAVAIQSSLSFAEGYGRTTRYEVETKVSTRLGDPTTLLRLARWNGETLQPLCNDAERSERERWQLSEVSVRRTSLGLGEGARDVPSRVRDSVVDAWGEFERDAVLVALQVGEDDLSRGEVVEAETGVSVVIEYSIGSGVVLRRSKAEEADRTGPHAIDSPRGVLTS